MNKGFERDELVTASFMMSGMHGKGIHTVIERWNSGFIELVLEMLFYVKPLVDYSHEVAAKHDELYPGVFAYEVSEVFGAWFAEYVILNGIAPDNELATKKCIDLVDGFFEQ